MTTEKFTIPYKVKRETCHCCGKELENSDTSDEREFDIYVEDLLEYTDWKHLIEWEGEDEVFDTVDEYVTHTIGFFATRSEDVVLFEENDINKMVQFLISKFKEGESHDN